ncbi:sugar phosphate isomerase/epimerase family protein [Alicyclobacillus fodiniaquatilis]|jgi:sugar phosphate isomerase/epimerase|uniref:Sugar phosphate isomerase/epimerase family protein n=1 Tax=Alicyclobacillus fodiniaquatilis TaxID=1661150 RepID=A0ABW4JNH2_9BACL
MFPFKLSLNASTLLPFKLDITEQIRIAAAAGYEGIEIWVRDLDAYLENGGTLKELRDHIEQTGIQVVNAIAFWKWSDANETERSQGFEQAKRELEQLAQIGCAAAAAPPFGNVDGVSLDDMASQFAKLTELARDIGVEPLLEFWGRANQLSRLSDAVYVAMESGVADAKILLDPFHMYTGGSKLSGLSYLNGDRIGMVHVNDYPETPSRETIADKDRVFPGEGILPSNQFAQKLWDIGYRGYLSLELFIEDFQGKTALDVAKQGVTAIQKAYSIDG